jgi:sirohydrochlorin cobaltochelatase
MNCALILLGHGARDPAWARPLAAVRERLLADAPKLRIELAFLELMSPSLDEVVAQLAAVGCIAIVVLPMFIAQSGHLKRDLPLQLTNLRERFPELRLTLADAVGESALVQEAMAEQARRLLPMPRS